jgi:FkbM family methyltransferase
MINFSYKNRLVKNLDCFEFNDKFTIIDIGARGNIGEPLTWIPEKYLNLIGFEPDYKEFLKLKDKFINRQYFNYALSDKKKVKTFWNLKDPSSSSFYKPNIKHNKRYNNVHHLRRFITHKSKVVCNKLDNFAKQIQYIDFLKIDTDGSEFDILKGGRKILKKNSPIVLIETWCDSIYKNIKMFDEIINLMRKYGYRVIDIDKSAAPWKFSTNIKFSELDLTIQNGFEILFVKDYEKLIKLNNKKIIKLIILLDLFGYKNFAYHLANKSKKIDKKTLAKLNKKIIFYNTIDSLLMKFPFNILIKLLIRYKLMKPINPQLHF